MGDYTMNLFQKSSEPCKRLSARAGRGPATMAHLRGFCAHLPLGRSYVGPGEPGGGGRVGIDHGWAGGSRVGVGVSVGVGEGAGWAVATGIGVASATAISSIASILSSS